MDRNALPLKEKCNLWNRILTTGNSTENFLKYIEDAVEKYSAAVKNLCVLGCYLIPTIDKPTRVYRTSASLTDNISFIIPGSVCCKWQPYCRC